MLYGFRVRASQIIEISAVIDSCTMYWRQKKDTQTLIEYYTPVARKEIEQMYNCRTGGLKYYVELSSKQSSTQNLETDIILLADKSDNHNESSLVKFGYC